MEQLEVTFEPMSPPNAETINVLTEAVFNQKYPKGDILSRRGAMSIVYHIAGLESKVRKENQSDVGVGREQLVTEAIAVSRIHDTPVDIALIGNYDIAIAVPKALGKPAEEYWKVLPNLKETIQNKIVRTMVHHVQEAHQSGVIVGEVKVEDMIIEGGTGSKTAWVDYSNGCIMPSISEKAIRQLQYDVGRFEWFSLYLKRIGGGEEALRDFLRDAEALAQHLEDYKSGKIALKLNDAVSENIGWHGDGLELLKQPAVTKFFGEQKVAELIKEVNRDTVSKRKIIESKEYKQQLLTEINTRAQKISIFLQDLVAPARKLERDLGMEYGAWNSSFSRKAGEYINAQITSILGYTDSSLTSLKGLLVAPGVPFNRQLTEAKLREYRTGNFLCKGNDEAKKEIDDFFHRLQTSYARYTVDDWKELFRKAKLVLPAQGGREATVQFLSQMESAISQMEKLIEAGDVSKIHALEQRLVTDLG